MIHQCNCPYCPVTVDKSNQKGSIQFVPRVPNWSGCDCNTPLLMVIPPEGTYLNCPVHGVRFVQGPINEV